MTLKESPYEKNGRAAMDDTEDRDFNEMDETEDSDLHEMDETEDPEFNAFRTGLRAFAAVASDWKSLRIDRRLGRRDRASQHDADDIAQSVAKGLLRYLSSCP